MNVEQIWTCKIGGAVANCLPSGADAPMRNAIEEAFHKLTGMWPDFNFSGWSGQLTEGERAVVENRLPSEQDHRDFLLKQAAPDLLAALYNMLEDGDQTDRQQALAAIRKATAQD